MKKDDAVTALEELLENVHIASKEHESSLIKLPGNKLSKLSERCVRYIELMNGFDEEQSIVIEDRPIKSHILEIDRELAYEKASGTRILMLSGIAMFAGVIFLWFNWGADIQGMLKAAFGVVDSTKYIILGISGAIVFFVTEGLSIEEDNKNSKKLTPQRLIAHTAFAIIIPIVLVVVFFSGDTGAIKTEMRSLLCFAAGYSSKLVLMLLNKIVEKGEKIIKTL